VFTFHTALYISFGHQSYMYVSVAVSFYEERPSSFFIEEFAEVSGPQICSAKI
jgi:hypothetical protein